MDDIGQTVTSLLDEIHNSLYRKAKEGRDQKVVQVTEWKDFVPNLEQKCLVLTPFCDDREWEDKVKVSNIIFEIV